MQDLHQTHDAFRGIADPTRRKILKFLTGGDHSIASITNQFPISRNAINKHLKILLDAHLVSKKKKGRETRFYLHTDPLQEIKDWIRFFDLYWDEKLSTLKEIVEKKD